MKIFLLANPLALSLIPILSLVQIACTNPRLHPNGDLSLSFPGEKHLTNLRQLTFGGTNAEAYWSHDGKWLSFQRKNASEDKCDQIFKMRADGSLLGRISNGGGRTTCSFYFPDDSRILFSSTFAANSLCPPNPDMTRGYVWPIYPTYQIYSVRPDGTDLIPLEPGAPKAYNAEAVTCADGSLIFTSDREGDLELYRAKLDPQGTISDITRLTHTLGYDGGAFFSSDCKKIVWRASRPKPGKETQDYLSLLKQHQVRPTQLEIWVANADGSHARQITKLSAASFAPYFTPNGSHVLFSSNARTPNGRKFDLYSIQIDGTHLEQVTFSDHFDSFPMFSPDGKHLAFSSNRNARQPHETNVFVGDWIEVPDRTLSIDDPIPADRFMATIENLSAHETESPGDTLTGLAEILKTENFIEERFSSIGLKPFFDVYQKAALGAAGSGYRQTISSKSSEQTLLRNNLLGVLGEGCRTHQPIVIGTHYQPQKLGSSNDDDTGLAGLLEIARIMKNSSSLKKACFIFAALTTGATPHFIELLKTAQTQPKAMLNLGQIGRFEENQLVVSGIETAQEWQTLLKTECENKNLTCTEDKAGFSTLMPAAGVPTLQFSTPLDSDLKINATGGIQIADLVSSIALQLALPKQKLHYKRLTDQGT